MSSILKIGLLLDSLDVYAWQYTMIEKIIHQDCAEINLIILNDRTQLNMSKYDRIKKGWHKILYHIYNKTDYLLFKKNPDAFVKKNLIKLLPDTKVIKVKPVQRKFSDYIKPNDIINIKNQNIDILIRMGFRILKGPILTVAKYGVWSYHHGDNRKIRGGPPGFWETVENWDETGSILQILNEDLDGGRVIYRSWSSTDKLSPARNRNNLYWKSLSFLPRRIEQLYRFGEKKFFAITENLNHDFDFYDARLYTIPTNWIALKIIMKQSIKILHKIIEEIFYNHHWILLFHLQNDISLSIRTYKKIVPPKDRFWADPHVLKYKDKFYVFIEEFLYKSKKGHIAVIEINEKGEYKKSVKVLEKNYHLAYPFVFKWQEKVYMIPATHVNKTIELYECSQFPYEFKFKMNLMENISAADTTVFFHEGKWWLFTAICENEGSAWEDELFLFYSDELFTNKWNAHPLNPVVSDVKKARPAGRIFSRNGKIYRPSQDCSKYYGYGFNIQEIVVLTETEYVERTISTVKPNWEKKILRTHSFAYEEGIIVIDAYMKKRKYF